MSETNSSKLETEVTNGTTQDHSGDDTDDGPPPQPAPSEQPLASTDVNGNTNSEITPDSSNTHQVDSESTQAQTDASASPPHAVKACSNTHTADHTPDHAVVRLIQRADKSAGRLVNLLATHFPSSFRDEARFDGKRVKLFKRAQIFVADLWAALNARGLGEFGDVDHLTMFPGTSMLVQHERGVDLGVMCMEGGCSTTADVLTLQIIELRRCCTGWGCYLTALLWTIVSIMAY